MQEEEEEKKRRVEMNYTNNFFSMVDKMDLDKNLTGTLYLHGFSRRVWHTLALRRYFITCNITL